MNGSGLRLDLSSFRGGALLLLLFAAAERMFPSWEFFCWYSLCFVRSVLTFCVCRVICDGNMLRVPCGGQR